MLMIADFLAQRKTAKREQAQVKNTIQANKRETQMKQLEVGNMRDNIARQKAVGQSSSQVRRFLNGSMTR